MMTSRIFLPKIRQKHLTYKQSLPLTRKSIKKFLIKLIADKKSLRGVQSKGKKRITIIRFYFNDFLTEFFISNLAILFTSRLTIRFSETNLEAARKASRRNPTRITRLLTHPPFSDDLRPNYESLRCESLHVRVQVLHILDQD